jgi:hypothetical protein
MKSLQKSKSHKSHSRLGFGISNESARDYARNFLKQNRFISAETIQLQQEAWRREYTQRNNKYSLEDLLQCEHQDLKIEHNSEVVWARSTHHHLKRIVSGASGFWHLEVMLNTRYNAYDFTLSVNTGSVYRFQPDAIKRDIVRKYGSAIYSTWRSMVLDDLASLRRLVEVVRNEINFVVPSIVCCPSSRRLCERAGIYVQNNVAFLFPSYYE